MMIWYLNWVYFVLVARVLSVGTISYLNDQFVERQETDGSQSIVTWDKYSFFVNEERLVFYSGEFHPFRLPVPDLWLDVFQKVKSLGFNAVSFYVNWALLEGEEGVYRADGVFALEPFFDAASEAGIYLLARPGPYINAEVSSGGFPGWLSRVPGTFRTNASGFLDATDLYMEQVCTTIAKAQITNGGPVVLFQPENEYTYPENNITFPNSDYFRYVIQQARQAGIVVPMISNDAAPLGTFAPTPNATVGLDVYGHDSYPQGFTASTPLYWRDGALPTDFGALHQQQSPNTPYSIIEFQGGSFDPWGGYGVDNCALLTNEQFERVFYKNNWASHVTFQNAYMIFGGTNWGNLGHPLGYTSYDYGAAIKEDRAVDRAKYSELKLLANFLKVVPSYLTSRALNYTNGSYVSTTDIAVTPVLGTDSITDLYIVRHAAYNSNATTDYTLTVPISGQTVTIPQLSTMANSLSLIGRDSKVHIVNYDQTSIRLLYTSAEIFTYQSYYGNDLLVLYGDMGEVHEFALQGLSNCSIASGSKNVVSSKLQGNTVFQWSVQTVGQVVTCEALSLYLVSRQDVYDWWVLELPAPAPVSNYSSPSKQSVVIKGGYLLRTAQISDGDLYVVGDINKTTTFSVIGAPAYKDFFLNGQKVEKTSDTRSWSVEYVPPTLSLPNLRDTTWYSLDSLPEILPTYSDSLWTTVNHTETVNQFAPTTPQVLYASDYGYNSGSLLYRGHFTTPSNTNSLNLSILTQGGQAYGYSVFLNSNNIYQYPGISTSQNDNTTLPLANLTPNTAYIITILIDHMGLTENFNPGNDTMREPRGLLSYNLTSTSAPSSSTKIPITWKLTGNLGGEKYIDKTRGPLNEGGMYFERQGYHLPGAPVTNTSIFTSSTADSSLTPFIGISSPGVRFYATSFNLSLPANQYDIPLAFIFTNTTTTTQDSSSQPTTRPLRFRALLYVNGFQFGKYVNHIGPQTVYPVPEGILNYNGGNYVGLSLWSLEDEGVDVRLDGFELSTSSMPVMSTLRRVPGLSYKLPEDGWTKRKGAY